VTSSIALQRLLLVPKRLNVAISMHMCVICASKLVATKCKPTKFRCARCTEAARWAPDLRVVRFHTNDVGERKRLRQEVRKNPRRST